MSYKFYIETPEGRVDLSANTQEGLQYFLEKIAHIVSEDHNRISELQMIDEANSKIDADQERLNQIQFEMDQLAQEYNELAGYTNECENCDE